MKPTFSTITIAAMTSTVAFITGCGGVATQSGPASVAPAGSATRCGALATPWILKTSSARCGVDRHASWMARGAATSAELLYVSDIGAEDVDVLSYPEGKRVGQLTGFSEPGGLCADGKGDVFIADTYNSRVVEYAHGGTKPIAVLQDSNNHPLGCAIDPTTGDLAVSNYNYLATGSIGVYKKARGSPTFYGGLWITFFCTYDGSGNLFIDGFSPSGPVVIGELEKGGTSLTTIPLNVQAGWAGGLEWDGKHLAMGDDFANKFVTSEPYPVVIYKLSLVNSFAHVIKTVPLVSAGDIVQFWLSGKTAIGPDASEDDVGFWKYPHGGNPTRTKNNFYEPVGATLSK